MKALLPRIWVQTCVGLCLTAAVASWAIAQPSVGAPVSSDARLARGQYLLTILACADCHTPFKMKPPPLPALPEGWMWAGSATNTAFAGPWGVSYAPNLTPHPSGLGQWTEEMFIQALRTGKHAGVGRPILPPMPWMAYGKLTDDDLKALLAALRAIPPINNAAPPSEPAPSPPPQ
jgi:mono/diheme cytochrome c family protein